MNQTFLATLALLAFSTVASATPVTVAFEGVITSLEDDYGDFGGAQVGDPFSGTYSYDDATTATTTSSSTRADYAMPMEFEVSIGSALIAPGPLANGALARIDGPYLAGGFGGPLVQIDEDRYLVQVRELMNVMDLLLNLEQGPAGALVVGLALTGNLPDASLANVTNRFSLVTRTGSTGGGFIPTFLVSQFQGTVTSLSVVPEPGTAVLVAVAVAAFANRKRAAA